MRIHSLPSPLSTLALASLLLIAGMAGLRPSLVSAYCRASDARGANGACVPDPDVPFLYWSRPCVAYVFNRDLFGQIEMMDETQVRGAFDAAFEAWADVDCSGRSPFFVEQLSGTTRSAKSEFVRDVHNEMVILAVEPSHWAELPGHSPSAIAMTLMWHDTKTGEIFDVDMELNLGAGSFADCVVHTCEAGMIDLQNTVTHEAGHVLGLGHSTVRDSTMAFQARGQADVDKRSLDPDDEAGYCALDLPQWQCKDADCSCPAGPVLTSASVIVTSDTAGCQATGLASETDAIGSMVAWLFTGLGGARLAARARRRAKMRARA